jgi:acyl transferase domain-containing protein
MGRTPIAIIGMGGIYPGALNLDQYWENIKNGRDAFMEVPDEIWRPDLYFSEDRNDKYKTYGKIGAPVLGFEFPFNKYRVPPNMLKNLDPAYLMTIEAVRMAIEGLKNPLTEAEKEGTAIVYGCSGIGDAQKSAVYLRRKEYWYYLEKELQQLGVPTGEMDQLKEAFEDYFKKFYVWDPTAAGLGSIPNVLSCLTAYLFNLRGFNMAVDAACASSLAAMEITCRALETGDADVVIAGGVDNNINPELFIGFARVNGLSATWSHPFDASANGILMGQGTGVLIMKRLEDAVANGDEIHAVIRGIGMASDGGSKAIFAPDMKGIERCIENALDDAGWTTDMVDFVEAHATATVVGDATEWDALGNTYGANRTKSDPVYLGAVKELIGHLKAGAGVAGIIKAVLALKHETIPPISNFKSPNPNSTYSGDGMAITTTAIPWKIRKDNLRRAGVSSNGFGGINFHVLLERGTEYQFEKWERPAPKEYALVRSGALVPGADNEEQFWQNMLDGKDNFREIGEESFDWNIHGTTMENPEPEKTYSKLFGKLENFKFNSIKFKIAPKLAEQMDNSHQYGLELTRRLGMFEMLKEKPELKQRTSVVVGAMINNKSMDVPYLYRFVEYEDLVSRHPVFKKLPAEKQQEIKDRIRTTLLSKYPPSTEETMPGWMHNVLAGRISKCFDIQGSNFIVDSACSSSLAALLVATYQLHFRTADQVIVGGAAGNRSSELTTVLSSIQAIGGKQPSPFTGNEDGFLLGDGGVFFLLKRLEDAERDGDDIMGVVSGVSGSSEGAQRSLLASSTDRIGLAIQRAFKKSPDNIPTVDFVETHGAGTIGDKVEAESVHKYLKPVNAGEPIYITAVKSHLGHLLGGAGSSGLLSTLLAIKHKMVPQIRNLDSYHPGIEPILDQVRPVQTNTPLKANNHLIKAGIINLGLGGANYFAFIREYDPSKNTQQHTSPQRSVGQAVSQASPAKIPMDTSRSISDTAMLDEDDVKIYFYGCNSKEEAMAHLNELVSKGTIQTTDEAQVLSNKSFRCRLSFTYSDEASYRRKVNTLLKGLQSGMDVSLLDSQGIYWTERA